MRGILLALLACLALVPALRAAVAPSSSSAPAVEARRYSLSLGFQRGFAGFNFDGVGEVKPKVVSRGRRGNRVCRFELVGSENRSELTLGQGNMIRFGEGAEYWYGFSFKVIKMRYGRPGAHNLIMQFKSDGSGSPNFGLQLWNAKGRRGLWTSGQAEEIHGSGERFLAPVSQRTWHRVEIQFRASSHRAGFYRIFLDGRLVDRRKHVSMIVPGKGFAYIKTGIYRNGSQIPGKSVLLLDSVELGGARGR